MMENIKTLDKTGDHKCNDKKTEEEFDENIKKVLETQNETRFSIKRFTLAEFKRNYLLENNASYYEARREQVQNFVRIPLELEQFMIFGLLQCLDSIINVFTYLPIRVIRAYCKLIVGFFITYWFRDRTQRILTYSEYYELIKYSYFLICCLIVICVDTNYLYHIIKTQSMFKLYIFYNMLEIGERVLSIYAQYPLDAFYYTVTQTNDSRSRSWVLYNLLPIIYMIMHCTFVTVQATTISVAVNSSQQELLMIMMSNNFNKLKRSLFKKYSKAGMQHLTCADIRDRFHLTTLILITFGITMKELNWDFDNFCLIMRDCSIVVIAGLFLDWLKHAFINCFNGLSNKIYKDFMFDLAKDISISKNENAYSDHSDIVARYLGFTPFPLAVMLVKAIYITISFRSRSNIIFFLLLFILMALTRIFIIIYTLAKSNEVLKSYKMQQKQM
ncbi:protein TAPT1 homolog [Teleopsis dalmanni]|uniref:protein TAPT1 homolog n=1 Tax=Teleopsis dalmanni TaxID=139649 RepID=UPI0018CEA999|nr:protein TAPT1 homolog [Teleopsis dalmanni]